MKLSQQSQGAVDGRALLPDQTGIASCAGSHLRWWLSFHSLAWQICCFPTVFSLLGPEKGPAGFFGLRVTVCL